MQYKPSGSGALTRLDVADVGRSADAAAASLQRMVAQQNATAERALAFEQDNLDKRFLAEIAKAGSVQDVADQYDNASFNLSRDILSNAGQYKNQAANLDHQQTVTGELKAGLGREEADRQIASEVFRMQENGAKVSDIAAYVQGAGGSSNDYNSYITRTNALSGANAFKNDVDSQNLRSAANWNSFGVRSENNDAAAQYSGSLALDRALNPRTDSEGNLIRASVVPSTLQGSLQGLTAWNEKFNTSTVKSFQEELGGKPEDLAWYQKMFGGQDIQTAVNKIMKENGVSEQIAIEAIRMYGYVSSDAKLNTADAVKAVQYRSQTASEMNAGVTMLSNLSAKMDVLDTQMRSVPKNSTSYRRMMNEYESYAERSEEVAGQLNLLSVGYQDPGSFVPATGGGGNGQGGPGYGQERGGGLLDKAVKTVTDGSLLSKENLDKAFNAIKGVVGSVNNERDAKNRNSTVEGINKGLEKGIFPTPDVLSSLGQEEVSEVIGFLQSPEGVAYTAANSAKNGTSIFGATDKEWKATQKNHDTKSALDSIKAGDYDSVDMEVLANIPMNLVPEIRREEMASYMAQSTDWGTGVASQPQEGAVPTNNTIGASENREMEAELLNQYVKDLIPQEEKLYKSTTPAQMAQILKESYGKSGVTQAMLDSYQKVNQLHILNQRVNNK